MQTIPDHRHILGLDREVAVAVSRKLAALFRV
jgi:hypothetical protein